MAQCLIVFSGSDRTKKKKRRTGNKASAHSPAASTSSLLFCCSTPCNAYRQAKHVCLPALFKALIEQTEVQQHPAQDSPSSHSSASTNKQKKKKPFSNFCSSLLIQSTWPNPVKTGFRAKENKRGGKKTVNIKREQAQISLPQA